MATVPSSFTTNSATSRGFSRRHLSQQVGLISLNNLQVPTYEYPPAGLVSRVVTHGGWPALHVSLNGGQELVSDIGRFCRSHTAYAGYVPEPEENRHTWLLLPRLPLLLDIPPRHCKPASSPKTTPQGQALWTITTLYHTWVEACRIPGNRQATLELTHPFKGVGGHRIDVLELTGDDVHYVAIQSARKRQLYHTATLLRDLGISIASRPRTVLGHDACHPLTGCRDRYDWRNEELFLATSR